MIYWKESYLCDTISALATEEALHDYTEGEKAGYH